MRRLVPVLGVGCASLILLTLVIGGGVMLVRGLGGLWSDRPHAEDAAPQPDDDFRGFAASLTEARKGFHSTLNLVHRGGPSHDPDPPLDIAAEIVSYRSPAGILAAYQSRNPGDGEQHPAIVWSHAGFQGISRSEWDKTRQLRDKDFVVCCPSFRGEHRNPGAVEMLYGEVDDLLAAVRHVASLSFVNRERIYVVGQGEGGTLALLAAEMGAEKTPRAFFAIGGAVDLRSPRPGGPLGPVFPIDAPNPREWDLRSPDLFPNAIRRPTFYFGAEQSQDTLQARRMAARARQAGAPIQVVALRDESLPRVLAIMIPQLRSDVGSVCKIHFGEHPEVAADE